MMIMMRMMMMRMMMMMMMKMMMVMIMMKKKKPLDHDPTQEERITWKTSFGGKRASPLSMGSFSEALSP